MGILVRWRHIWRTILRQSVLWRVIAILDWYSAACGKLTHWMLRDTGYRAVPGDVSKEKQYDEAYLESLPHCPAFKGERCLYWRYTQILMASWLEIGEKVGPFDLAMIPIGAYSPRWFMSTVHCSPEDAVRVHEDIRSKKSVGRQNV